MSVQVFTQALPIKRLLIQRMSTPLPRIPALTLGVLLLSFTSASYAQTEWALKRDALGIQVYQKPSTQGHAVTRGVSTMRTTLDAVVSMMRDNHSCSRWLYSCKSSRNIVTKSASERLDYSVLDSPLLLADRDMYVYSTSEYDAANQTMTIRNVGKAQYDQGQPNRVRIQSLDAYWEIQQITQNKVRVLYQLSSDPQLIRSSFLDKHIATSVFQTLRRIATVSQQAPYKNSRLPETQ